MSETTESSVTSSSSRRKKRRRKRARSDNHQREDDRSSSDEKGESLDQDFLKDESLLAARLDVYSAYWTLTFPASDRKKIGGWLFHEALVAPAVHTLVLT